MSGLQPPLPIRNWDRDKEWKWRWYMNMVCMGRVAGNRSPTLLMRDTKAPPVQLQSLCNPYTTHTMTNPTPRSLTSHSKWLHADAPIAIPPAQHNDVCSLYVRIFHGRQMYAVPCDCYILYSTPYHYIYRQHSTSLAPAQ